MSLLSFSGVVEVGWGVCERPGRRLLLATEDTENGDGNFFCPQRATKNTFFPRRATENGNGTLFFPFRGPKIGAHLTMPSKIESTTTKGELKRKGSKKGSIFSYEGGGEAVYEVNDAK